MAAARAILLVEDDRDIREIMQDALESEGYAVVAAIDGVDALDKLRAAAAPPGLILLDMMMPRMNGAQFRDEQRKVAAWADIPVVIVTADAGARARGAALGAAAFLQKPVGLDELYAVVGRVLGPAA